MRTLLTAFMMAVLSLLAIAPSMTAAAQDATPAPLGAADCTVAPVDPTTYAVAIIASTPVPNPPATISGQPADEATVAAVIETMRQSIACTNAGDIGRLLSLTDPSYAPTLLSLKPDQIQSAVEAAAAGSATPVSIATPFTDEQGNPLPLTSLIGVTNVLADIVDMPDGYFNGQVVASVTIFRPGIGVVTATVYLRQDHGRYMITNYVYETVAATPVP